MNLLSAAHTSLQEFADEMDMDADEITPYTVFPLW
jgi:hypothetical protein